MVTMTNNISIFITDFDITVITIICAAIFHSIYFRPNIATIASRTRSARFTGRCFISFGITSNFHIGIFTPLLNKDLEKSEKVFSWKEDKTYFLPSIEILPIHSWILWTICWASVHYSTRISANLSSNHPKLDEAKKLNVEMYLDRAIQFMLTPWD